MTPEQRATLPLMRVALYSKAGEPIDWAAVKADIAQHIREAVAAEREACAQTVASLNSDDDYPVCCAAANAQAVAAIRARQ